MDEAQFQVVITKELGEIPYVELRIDDRYDPISITFRAYPRRVFVAIEDDTNNPSTGADLDDCFICPPLIIAKVPRETFDVQSEFLRACKRAYGPDASAGYFEDEYKLIEPEVGRWLAMWK